MERYGTKLEWLSPRFAILYRSWWLQGQSVRSHIRTLGQTPQPHPDQYDEDCDWWKQVVDQSALLITEYVSTTGDNIVDSLICTGLVSTLTSSISITFQRARELICDTVAHLLTIGELHRSFAYFHPVSDFDRWWIRNASTPARSFGWSANDFVFLTTCLIGDTDAVQQSLHLTDCSARRSEDTERVLSTGLYIAVGRDHRKLVCFLTPYVKISAQDRYYILCAAAQSGNIFMLRLFLGPEYSELRDIYCLEHVFVRAAEHTNTAIRIEMCKLLLAYYGRLTNMRLRTKMLLAACRSNDIIFAQWVIGTGPVKFYGRGIGAGLYV